MCELHRDVEAGVLPPPCLVEDDGDGASWLEPVVSDSTAESPFMPSGSVRAFECGEGSRDFFGRSTKQELHEDETWLSDRALLRGKKRVAGSWPLLHTQMSKSALIWCSVHPLATNNGEQDRQHLADCELFARAVRPVALARSCRIRQRISQSRSSGQSIFISCKFSRATASEDISDLRG